MPKDKAEGTPDAKDPDKRDVDHDLTHEEDFASDARLPEDAQELAEDPADQ